MSSKELDDDDLPFNERNQSQPLPIGSKTVGCAKFIPVNGGPLAAYKSESKVDLAKSALMQLTGTSESNTSKKKRKPLFRQSTSCALNPNSAYLS